MDTIKLNQIEELLNTLITVIQKGLQNTGSYGIVTQKELLKIWKAYVQSQASYSVICNEMISSRTPGFI